MTPRHPPIPPYAVTDGTYWPNGRGTIPPRIQLPDDGWTYIVIDISNATAGDSLDALIFNGIDILGASVPMVAGDEDQSADDIVTQIEATTANVFVGTAASGGRVVISRDNDGSGIAGTSYFTATTTNGTTISVVFTRWLIEEAGTHPDGKYYILDALDPGGRTIYPEYQEPTLVPPSGPFRTAPWTTFADGLWIYMPEFHTVHMIKHHEMMGGGGLSGTWGTHLFVTLEPALPSTTSAQLPFEVIGTAPQGIVVANTGGADGELNGYNFPDGAVFDRSQFPQALNRPVTYDSSSTQYTITVNV